MPGIIFQSVREQISMARVVELLQYEPTAKRGDSLRGLCPIHGSTSSGSRIFSVDLAGDRFHCFKCGARGNQLDLWATVHKLKLVDAAKDLCGKTGIDVPYVTRW